jgi:P4 family phage/plasmid primase-like protien
LDPLAEPVKTELHRQSLATKDLEILKVVDVFFVQTAPSFILKMPSAIDPSSQNWPEIYAAAQSYQQRGLTVVPVNREKKTLCKFTGLTPDNCLERLRNCAPRGDEHVSISASLHQPQSALTGIALRTGDPILVIDLDLDDKLGDGRLHWQELLTEWGIEPPQTWQVESGSGGQHLYFRWEPRFTGLGQNTKIGGKAIDLRTTNGYIVAPPSPWFDKKQEFAFTNRYYSWLHGCSPEELEIGRLPEPAFEWLLLHTSTKAPKVPKPPAKKAKPKAADRTRILPEGSEDEVEAESLAARDASPKRVHLPNYANEIAKLVLPLVCENEGGELDFHFSKYKNKTTLIFLRNGPDPAICSLCRPIREAKGMPLEPHTSQNRCAVLGIEARLDSHWYRQVFVGCYAERTSLTLAGWLVSGDGRRPLSISKSLPECTTRCPELFHLPQENNLFVRPLTPEDVPPGHLLNDWCVLGDRGDAQLFLWLYEKDIVYDSGRQVYYFFVGHTWRQDPNNSAIFELLERLSYCWNVAALQSVHLDDAKTFLKQGTALSILSLNRIEAYVRHRLTRSELPWNALAGHLPFKNGILNMLTGELAPGKPSDWFNLDPPLSWYGLEAARPVFERTYLQCFGDNHQVFDFFQRLLGYAMSGDSNEDVLAFLTGSLGRSGKSTLYEVLQLAFGPDLVRQVSADVLMSAKAAQAGAAQPHLVDLDGVRFAVIEEGSQSGSLNVTQAKWLSGTKGSIRVRGLHQGYRYVRALFTLFCFQNDYPKCPPHAEALWRRIVNLNMPFQHVPQESLTNPNTQRPADPQLMQKLRDELPGIVAWVVRGYQLYRQQGLAPPPDVFKSTQAFRTAVDSLDEWLRASCEQGPALTTEADLLHASYKEFTGDNATSQIAFSKALEQHGFPKTTIGRRSAHRGLSLL